MVETVLQRVLAKDHGNSIHREDLNRPIKEKDRFRPISLFDELPED